MELENLLLDYDINKPSKGFGYKWNNQWIGGDAGHEEWVNSLKNLFLGIWNFLGNRHLCLACYWCGEDALNLFPDIKQFGDVLELTLF